VLLPPQPVKIRITPREKAVAKMRNDFIVVF